MRRQAAQRDWFTIVGSIIVAAIVVAMIAFITYMIWFEINDPGHGQITKKHYSPAYWYQSCSTVNKSTICTPHYMPECYEIDYNDGHHDGDACVSPDEYDGYEVGGYYPRGWTP